jgi:hypothetical protein
MNPTAIRRLSFSTASDRSFWYRLFDSQTGQPYKTARASSVFLSPDFVIDQFRKVVKAEWNEPGYLKDIPAGALTVYKNQEAFETRNEVEGKDEPLDPTESLGALGTKEHMLIVAVPTLSSVGLMEQTLSIITKVHPKRKERWDRLNKILEQKSNNKRSGNDSTPYSSLTWEEVKEVFNPSDYVQPRRPIDDNQIDFLSDYLSRVRRSIRFLTGSNEATRRHFIAPILVCVCHLFKGDVEIVIEEDLRGNSVKAHGHFDFMLRRGNTVVFIVEAKREDFRQGTAQDLVGCEVAAEVGGLSVVHGIVTNFMEWVFLRSLNDRIEREDCQLILRPDGPQKESLKEIAEKIYAMLSNDL